MAEQPKDTMPAALVWIVIVLCSTFLITHFFPVLQCVR